MRYKNVSAANIRLTENRFLGPNAEIELSEEDEKSPEIINMIKDLEWLVVVKEKRTASKSIISHGLPEVKGSKVYIPTTYSEHVNKDKLIADAVRRAAEAKRGWNPMDDAAPEGEPDFIAPPTNINTAKHYGNAELAYDATTKPVSHMGGTPNDSAETKNVSEVDLIPHHPEDLVKYQPKPLPKNKTRKKS
jgi:hypothetical protein